MEPYVSYGACVFGYDTNGTGLWAARRLLAYKLHLACLVMQLVWSWMSLRIRGAADLSIIIVAILCHFSLTFLLLLLLLLLLSLVGVDLKPCRSCQRCVECRSWTSACW